MLMSKPKINYICDPGTNWCGDFELLKKTAYECKIRGATYFKPQLWEVSALYSSIDNPYYEIQKNCELDEYQTAAIYDYCENMSLKCIFSVFDLLRLDWVYDLGIDTVKIAARTASDIDLLKQVYRYDMYPVISVSDQYCHLSVPEYDKILGENNYQLLHCVSKYPARIEDYSLSKTRIFGGISDHTDNIYLANAAAAVGANYIEKHIYYSWRDTPDADCSIDVFSLKYMIDSCNSIRKIREDNL